MPYIFQKRRDEILINPRDIQSSGELNFSLTRILHFYAESQGLSYRTINDIVGALEGAKMEFYRRVVILYENKKIKENGDVYDLKKLGLEKEKM